MRQRIFTKPLRVTSNIIPVPESRRISGPLESGSTKKEFPCVFPGGAIAFPLAKIACRCEPSRAFGGTAWQPPANSSQASIKPSRSQRKNIRAPPLLLKIKKEFLCALGVLARDKEFLAAPLQRHSDLVSFRDVPRFWRDGVAISPQLQPGPHSTKALRFSRSGIAALTMFARNDTRFGVLRRSTRPLPCPCKSPDAFPGGVAISPQLQPGLHKPLRFASWRETKNFSQSPFKHHFDLVSLQIAGHLPRRRGNLPSTPAGPPSSLHPLSVRQRIFYKFPLDKQEQKFYYIIGRKPPTLDGLIGEELFRIVSQKKQFKSAEKRPVTLR